MLRPLLIAIQFLTRLPVPGAWLQAGVYPAKQLGQSVLYYPVAGLLIGGLLSLIVYGQQQFFPTLATPIIAAFVLLAWVMLTGALHLDGLSDSADAWVGGYGDRDKTLAIMKDPYCGPAGVSVIVLLLLLKYAILLSVIERASLALLFSPLLGRTMILLLFLTTAYVRKGGIGASQAAHLPRKSAWLVLLMLVGACVYFLQGRAVWLWLAVLAVFFLLRQLMLQRLGGTTGDTAGAMIEILEVVVLLVFVVETV